MTVQLDSGAVAAIAECIDHARKVHYLSAEAVGAKIGVDSRGRWAFYKWLDEGRLPVALVTQFEQACRHTAVTRHLARASGHIAAPLLPADSLPQVDLAAAQLALAGAMGVVVEGVYGKRSAQDAVEAVSGAIEVLMGLRHKLAGRGQP